MSTRSSRRSSESDSGRNFEERPCVDSRAMTRDEYPLRIREYDPSWPSCFAALAARVQAALGDVVLRVEHIGSTAVPDLAAKPVVDLDVVVSPTRHHLYIVAEGSAELLKTRCLPGCITLGLRFVSAVRGFEAVARRSAPRRPQRVHRRQRHLRHGGPQISAPLSKCRAGVIRGNRLAKSAPRTHGPRGAHREARPDW